VIEKRKKLISLKNTEEYQLHFFLCHPFLFFKDSSQKNLFNKEKGKEEYEIFLPKPFEQIENLD